MTPHRALGWAIGSLALVGCAAALGLDAPTLDPCAVDASACIDGSTPGEAATDSPVEADAVALDVSADGREAGVDAGPDSGIRCGGGTYPLTYCDPAGATPTCCQTTTDAGVTTYGCVANDSACSGYAIDCATYNDCSGTEVCCHYMAHMVCDSLTSCPNANLVCTPAMTDSCPSGWSCSVYFSNEGVESPYMGCLQ
jgi:hypothetical protein